MAHIVHDCCSFYERRWENLASTAVQVEGRRRASRAIQVVKPGAGGAYGEGVRGGDTCGPVSAEPVHERGG